MSSFLELPPRLAGELPGLSPFLAEDHIRFAWRDIRNERTWGFFSDDAVIFCPAMVTSGTIAITQYSASAVCDATASAALLALNTTAQPPLTSMQIRFGGTSQTGQIYNITDFDDTVPAAVVLTLSRIVAEATNAGSSYQCYRMYVTPPNEDFLKFESLVDMLNGWTITGKRLTYSSAYFDFRDPQRQALGLAYYCGLYKGNSATSPPGQPIYELWPSPSSGQTFYTRFRRRGLDPDYSDPDDVIPEQIPDQLILSRAKAFYSYPWAAANVGSFPALRNSNSWITLIAQERQTYQNLLLQAKKNDDEQELQTVMNRGHGLLTRSRGWQGPGPADSAFWQSHPIYW